MSSVIYAIVFNGEILEGHQIISVKAHMAKMLKADADQITRLFSGKQVVLKKTPDKALALKYGTALKKVGANVKVRVIKSAAAAETPSKTIATPAARKEKPSSTSTGSLSLAPNIGNIVEPAPAAPPPDLDLSGLSIAEVGEGTLAEPTEAVEISLDLSSLNLAEPGEGMLAEPGVEVPKIEAPDFGLDEPGAMLETLHEEVEELNPDTSGMTIALAGADLLTEEDKQPEPEPVVPDVSKIQLVPNFDV